MLFPYLFNSQFVVDMKLVMRIIVVLYVNMFDAVYEMLTCNL